MTISRRPLGASRLSLAHGVGLIGAPGGPVTPPTTVVGATGAFNSGDSSDFTLDVPEGTAIGDRLVAFAVVRANSGGVLTAPGGWTEEVYLSDEAAIRTWASVGPVLESVPATVAFTLTATVAKRMSLVTLRGPSAFLGHGVESTGATAVSTLTAPAVATSGGPGGGLAIFMAAQRFDRDVTTPPPDYTEAMGHSGDQPRLGIYVRTAGESTDAASIIYSSTTRGHSHHLIFGEAP